MQIESKHWFRWKSKNTTQPKDCDQGLHRSDVLVPCSVKDESWGPWWQIPAMRGENRGCWMDSTHQWMASRQGVEGIWLWMSHWLEHGRKCHFVAKLDSFWGPLIIEEHEHLVENPSKIECKKKARIKSIHTVQTWPRPAFKRKWQKTLGGVTYAWPGEFTCCESVAQVGGNLDVWSRYFLW